SILRDMRGVRAAEGLTVLASKGASTLSGLGAASRAEIIDGLRGVTEQSDAIATAIKNGDIELHIMDDAAFAQRWLESSVSHPPVAFADGASIYVRRGSETLLSDVVHEGTHALDSINNYANYTVRATTHTLEFAAFKAEQNFQRAMNLKPDFANDAE